MKRADILNQYDRRNNQVRQVVQALDEVVQATAPRSLRQNDRIQYMCTCIHSTVRFYRPSAVRLRGQMDELSKEMLNCLTRGELENE